MGRVQFLFATTNNRIFSENPGVLEQAGEAIVINQLLDASVAPTQERAGVETVREHGLSRSRNRALAIATSDLCYVCDDDIALVTDAGRLVELAFEQRPHADILLFPLRDSDDGSVHYRSPPSWLPMRIRLMGVRSIQIAFRRRAVQQAGLRFDERFGLGAEFPSGEEAIFLSDAYDAKLRIEWTDVPIASHALTSSGMQYADRQLARAKGAVLCRVFGPHRFLYYLPFAAKSYPLYRAHLSLPGFIRALEAGARQFSGGATP